MVDQLITCGLGLADEIKEIDSSDGVRYMANAFYNAETRYRGCLNATKVYVIRNNVQDPEHNDFGTYWCNGLGWVDKDSAIVFARDVRRTMNLPEGGEWEEE